MSCPCACNITMNNSIPRTWSFYLENQNFHVVSPAKCHSGLISTLTRLIDTASLWCALKALTKNIFEKLDLRGKIICTLINKAGCGLSRMGNSFMQSLTLNHLLGVNILSKSTAFWMIERDVSSDSSSCKFERLRI